MTTATHSPTTAPNPPFAFSADNKKRIKDMLAKYPKGREASAVLPVLDLAQRQCHNWLPQSAIEATAEVLGMPPMRVMEVASFYSMFNLAPVGKYFIQCCRTTPCWLMGSDDVARAIKEKLGIAHGETSACRRFTVIEVECLGACVNAPVVQINDEYYEDLDYASMAGLIEAMQTDSLPAAGSVIGRVGSKAMPAKPASKGKGKRAKNGGVHA